MTQSARCLLRAAALVVALVAASAAGHPCSAQTTVQPDLTRAARQQVLDAAVAKLPAEPSGAQRASAAASFSSALTWISQHTFTRRRGAPERESMTLIGIP